MTTIRWGILGTGRMASTMAQELRSLSGQGAELIAVGSRSPRSAADFAQRFGIPRAYGSYAELASNSHIDAVYIATPPSEHAAHMSMCLESGRSVLCEKPFTVNAAEACQVVQLSRERGLFLMEAMWTRFLPAVETLRRMVADGAIGRPALLIGGGAFVPAYEPDYYLFSSHLGGGVLNDAGVYLVSLSSMLLGEPHAVRASGEFGEHGVDEHAAWILEHAGGARSLLYVSLRARRAPDLEILGSDGNIVVAPPVFRPTRLSVARSTGSTEILDFPIAGSGYGHQLMAAMAAIRRGEREVAAMPLEETLSVMATMDAIRSQFGSSPAPSAQVRPDI